MGTRTATNHKESDRKTNPEPAGTQEKLDALDDPDVKTALLNRMGDEL